jgi:putative endonuclease
VCTIEYIALPVEMSSAKGYPHSMGLPPLALSLESRVYTALRSFADQKSPLPEHLLIGERGEDAAFFHLRALGYTVVARRWRSARIPGDLDLVAWDGPTLIVFEVKTRTARDLASAEAAVDIYKQQMLRKMASAYLRQLPEPDRKSIILRFDVLSVYLLPDGPEFQHLRDVFPRAEPETPRWR